MSAGHSRSSSSHPARVLGALALLGFALAGGPAHAQDIPVSYGCTPGSTSSSFAGVDGWTATSGSPHCSTTDHWADSIYDWTPGPVPTPPSGGDTFLGIYSGEALKTTLTGLTAGTTYTAYVWLHSTGGGPSDACLDGADGAKIWVGGSSQTLPIHEVNAWERKSVTFTATGSSAAFYLNGTEPSGCYVDIEVGDDALGADQDADGLVDADEATWGTDPTDPDSDGDGVSDGDEVNAGTDPTVAQNPTIAPIADVELDEYEPVSVDVVLDDPDDAADTLTLTAKTSDGTVVTGDDIVLDGTGSQRTATLAARGLEGTAQIHLTVTDPAGLSHTAVFAATVACTDDLDGDGTCDTIDDDLDGDGLSNAVEGQADLDDDGVANDRDLDSDGDGLPDALEGMHHTDDDGVPDVWDLDSDGDGVPDALEGAAQSDGDGVPDFRDVDSDDDGLADTWEMGGDGLPIDTDQDGLSDRVDPDDDGDGVDTVDEQADPDGDGDPADAVDSDGDGTPDYLDAHHDAPVDPVADAIAVDEGDSLQVDVLANDEGILLPGQTRPVIVDAPAHGGANVLHDGTIRYTHDASESTADSFTYRLYDGVAHSTATATVRVTVRPVNDPPSVAAVADQAIDDESTATVHVEVADPDDAASDLALSATSSDPSVVADVALGGSGSSRSVGVTGAGHAGTAQITLVVRDAAGATATTTFAVAVTCSGDLDEDGVCDSIDTDTDGDSDGDGIADLIEGDGDPDGDGQPNYLDLDSDGDGLEDRLEWLDDPDGDGQPNYLDLDSDDDGLHDGDEYFELGTDPWYPDSDGDGLSDGEEVLDLGTDPLDADTDDDGLLDATEVDGLGPLADFGPTDPFEADDDGDGLQDGTEVGLLEPELSALDTHATDTASTFEPAVPGAPITDPRVADSDGDGVSDYDEYLDETGSTAPDTAGKDELEAGWAPPESTGAPDEDAAARSCSHGGPAPVSLVLLPLVLVALRRRR